MACYGGYNQAKVRKKEGFRTTLYVCALISVSMETCLQHLSAHRQRNAQCHRPPDAGRTYVQCRLLRSRAQKGGRLLDLLEGNLTLFTFLLYTRYTVACFWLPKHTSLVTCLHIARYPAAITTSCTSRTASACHNLENKSAQDAATSIHLDQ